MRLCEIRGSLLMNTLHFLWVLHTLAIWALIIALRAFCCSISILHQSTYTMQWSVHCLYAFGARCIKELRFVLLVVHVFLLRCTLVLTCYHSQCTFSSLSTAQNTAETTERAICSICTSSVRSPVVLVPCGHVFCLKCVNKWEAFCRRRPGVRCSLCKAEYLQVVRAWF